MVEWVRWGSIGGVSRQFPSQPQRDAPGGLARGSRGAPDVLSDTQFTAGVTCAAIESCVLRNISKTPIYLSIYVFNLFI